MARATVVATCPEGDGGNSSLWQEPGRPGRPAPTALASGRTNRPKRRPRDSPETSTNGSYPSNQEKTSQHCESKTPQAETWGSRTRKRNVSRSPCIPKSEGRHHRWNEKMTYKKRSGTTGTTVPMTRHGGNPGRVRTSKKIAKLDSFN